MRGFVGLWCWRPNSVQAGQTLHPWAASPAPGWWGLVPLSSYCRTLNCSLVLSVFASDWWSIIKYDQSNFLVISTNVNKCFLLEAEVAALRVQSQLWLVANNCKASIWDLEEELGVQNSNSQLASYKASLGYFRPPSPQKETKGNKNQPQAQKAKAFCCFSCALHSYYLLRNERILSFYCASNTQLSFFSSLLLCHNILTT